MYEKNETSNGRFHFKYIEILNNLKIIKLSIWCHFHLHGLHGLGGYMPCIHMLKMDAAVIISQIGHVKISALYISTLP